MLVRFSTVQSFESSLNNHIFFALPIGKYNFTDRTDRFQTPQVLKQRSVNVVLPRPLQTEHSGDRLQVNISLHSEC